VTKTLANDGAFDADVLPVLGRDCRFDAEVTDVVANPRGEEIL